MSLQNLVIGLVALVALATSYVALSQPVKQPVGAVSGPDSSFQCETHNGVGHCFYRAAFNAASTTLCAFKNTSPATSSIAYVRAIVTTGVANATRFDFARSTSYNASTTLLGAPILGSGLQGTMVASSTGNTQVDAAMTLPPSNYITVNAFGDHSTMTGYCTADIYY